MLKASDVGPFQPLRVVWRHGHQWYYCKDICRILGITQKSLNKMPPGLFWSARDHNYRRVKTVSFAGVCQLIALEGLEFSQASVLVELEEIPTIEPEGDLFERPRHINRAIAIGLGRILLGVAAHARKRPSLADLRRAEAEPTAEVSGGAIADLSQREDTQNEGEIDMQMAT